MKVLLTSLLLLSTTSSAYAFSESSIELSLQDEHASTVRMISAGEEVSLLSMYVTSSCTESSLLKTMDVFLLRGDANALASLRVKYGDRVMPIVVENDQRKISIEFDPFLSPEVCEPMPVEIIATINRNAELGSSVQVVLESKSDIFGSAHNVSGNFPIHGPVFIVSPKSSAAITTPRFDSLPQELRTELRAWIRELRKDYEEFCSRVYTGSTLAIIECNQKERSLLRNQLRYRLKAYAVQ